MKKASKIFFILSVSIWAVSSILSLVQRNYEILDTTIYRVIFGVFVLIGGFCLFMWAFFKLRYMKKTNRSQNHDQ